jgi:hypothetical protein
LGQITLFDLASNISLVALFPFIKESQAILEKIDENIFYIPFVEINPNKNLYDEETEEDIDYRMPINLNNAK